MGLQIVGPNHGELACLELAHAYDRSDGMGHEAAAAADLLKRLSRGALLFLAHHEIKIAQIDEQAEPWPGMNTGSRR